MKKNLTVLLIVSLLLTTIFVQPASAQTQETVTKQSSVRVVSSHDQFLKRIGAYDKSELKYDFEKEALKNNYKRSRLSSGQKTALYIGIIAGVVAAVALIIALRDNDDNNVSQCGSSVRAPCPPGCVCIQ